MNISKYGRTLLNKDRIIICNIRTGGYIKTMTHYYNLINDMVLHSGEIIPDLVPRNYNIDNTMRLYNALIDIGYYVSTTDTENSLTMAFIAVTNKCNLNCIHCSASSDIHQIEKLSLTEIKLIIQELSELKIKNINITGGEPLLRSDIIDILMYLISTYQGHITFSTNGVLITDRIADILTKCVDEVSISVDGYDEDSCSKIRGQNVFDKAITAVEKLHKRNYFNISLSMLLTHENIYEESRFKNLCKSLNVKPLIHRFTPSGRGAENITSLYTNKIYSRMNFSEAKPKLCFPGEKEIFIDSIGDIYPCGNLLDYKSLIMGNIKSNSIKEVLSKWKANNPMEKYRPWKIEPCRDCNVNLFCHSCISNVLNVKNSNIYFSDMCSIMHYGLSSVLW